MARWPLGGRRRGRPVLPSRHPEPPARPPASGASPPPAATQPYQAPPPPPAAPPRVPGPPPPPVGPPAAAAAPPPPPVTPPPAPAPPTGTSGSPPPAAVPPDDDSRPATLREIRSLRRWLAVAGVWALAATAIAVLAFITASDDDEQRLADTSSQARSIQRRVNRQVDQLEARLASVPKSADVRALQRTLATIQKATSRNDRQLVAVASQLQDIRDRLDPLEEAQAQTNTTTTP